MSIALVDKTHRLALQVDNVVVHMTKVQAEIKAAEEQSVLYNSREALFGQDPTDYSRIKKMKDQFDPFLQFWTTAGNWKKWRKAWMYNAFETLNAEEIERNVSNAWKTMFKMGKAFQLRDFNKCADNCEKVWMMT
jgi:dynein heavy chain